MTVIKKLDFAEVREDFKNFLSSQDEFSDYDLTQSGLDVMINMMSYGIHFDSFQANFSNNEMKLSTAQLRKNVTGRSKHLMYTPKSATAARAIIDLTISDTDSVTLPTTLFLPKGTKFVTTDSLTEAISFVTTSSYIANKTGDRFIFTSVPIYQGVYSNASVKYNGKSVQIDNERVDTSTIEVYVQEDLGNTTFTKYEKMVDLFDAKSDSRIFYLEENFNDRFEIYFGDGVLGKKVAEGLNVLVTFVVTNGEVANGINGFNFAKSPNPLDSINGGKAVVSVRARSSGGAEKESIESIKFNAPKFFTSQKIILNDSDASNIIPHKYPDIKSVNVWSGKESGAFGKTYLSLNPYSDEITDARIAEIVTDIEKSRTVILTSIEHVRPTYIDLGLKFVVYFDGETSIETIEMDLYDRVVKYSKDNIEDFKKKFISSKFIKEMASDNLQYDFSLNIISQIPVFVNTLTAYEFDFKNEITGLLTNDFTYQGSQHRIMSTGKNLVMFSRSSGLPVKTVGTIDELTGKGMIDLINIQAIENNTLKVIATPKRESIFSSNNNILRIDPQFMSISYEVIK